MGHNHDHSHTHAPGNGLTLAFWLNIIFSVVEAAGGIITNSSAIIADAFHDFMDAMAIGLAVLLEKISGRKRTSKFSYGYKRFSLLSAVGLSVFLLTGAVLMVLNAARSFMQPSVVDSKGMLWLALLGLAVNGIAFLRIKKTGTDKKETGCNHNHGHSHNSRAVMLHLLEDVLGWIAVLAGATVIYFTGWYWIDPLMAVGIAVFISYNAVRNLIATMRILLQGIPDDIDIGALNQVLKSTPGVASVHDLHVWSLDGNYNIASVHIVLDTDQSIPAKELHNTIIDTMKQHHIQHPTIQFETSDGPCGLIHC